MLPHTRYWASTTEYPTQSQYTHTGPTSNNLGFTWEKSLLTINNATGWIWTPDPSILSPRHCQWSTNHPFIFLLSLLKMMLGEDEFLYFSITNGEWWTIFSLCYTENCIVLIVQNSWHWFLFNVDSNIMCLKSLICTVSKSIKCFFLMRNVCKTHCLNIYWNLWTW